MKYLGFSFNASRTVLMGLVVALLAGSSFTAEAKPKSNASAHHLLQQQKKKSAQHLLQQHKKHAHKKKRVVELKKKGLLDQNPANAVTGQPAPVK